MKKAFRSIILILTASVLLFASAACGSASLQTPANLVIDDALTLSWSAVPNARSYRVEISDMESGEVQENVVQRRSRDLSALPVGEYTIRIKAVGGSKNDITSEWSDAIAFSRKQESGLLFTAVNGNTAYEVRSVGSASGDPLEIEAEYRGKPVVGIGETAFRGSTKITSVVIPETVTYIGASAFYNCANLVSVTIPETVVTIGRSAFQQCSKLETVGLPAALTEIAPFTFAYCRSLAALELGENIKSIGESAFTNCSTLAEITIPNSVQTIGRNAFRQATNLKKAVFGSEDGAENGGNDEAVDAGESVESGSRLTSIGSEAFSSCTVLEELEFHELGGSLTLASYAFALDPALETVELPQGVTSIASYCFAGDSALTSVKIPSSVTSIAEYAFYRAKLYDDQIAAGGLVYADNWIVDAAEEYKKTIESIDETTFREGTVGIADAAFRYTWSYEIEAVDDEGNLILDDEGNPVMRTVTEYVSCEKLRRIRFPSSLKYIGSAAFYHAPNLQRLLATYENSLVSVGTYAFAYSTKLDNVQFANGLREIDTRAFFRCELLDYDDNHCERIIPETVTRVGENAFFGTALWYRKDITDGIVYAGNWIVGYHIDPTYDGETVQSIVEVREGTVGICDYGFYGDQVLQNITGLNNVTTIGKGAFAFCTRLATVNLNRNLRSIADFTFYKCESIYSVSFPTMLQSIGKAAFYQCKQLHAIDLLETQVLSSIGNSAFRECTGLSTLDLGETVEKIGKYAFYGCNILREVAIPDSVKEIGVRAFGDCLSLNTLTIGAGLEEISDYAFSGCLWLRNVTIPATVKTVGNYAFYNCKHLSSLSLEEGVKTIGHYAFYGNEKLTHVGIPSSVERIGIYAFKGCTLLTSVLFEGTPAFIDENAFYGCPKLTFYGTGEGVGESWSALWNSSRRPAVWEAVLSEDGSYVESVTVGTVTDPRAHFGYSGPGRDGYLFVGWSTERGATEAEYTAAQLEYLPAGTTVYSVWEEAPEEDEDAWFREFVEWLQDMMAQQEDDDKFGEMFE